MSDQNGKLIVAAARELLENKTSSAYRVLITHLYEAIDRGISGALNNYDSEISRTLRDGYFTQFADQKLSDRSFLKGLLERATNPVGYTRTSAYNFVRSEIRKSPPMVTVRGEEFDGDEWGAGSAEVAATERDALVDAEDHQTRQQWLVALPLDDQLLLALMYVEAHDLPPTLVKLIARRRAAEVEAVARELDARASVQSEARRQIQRELDERIERTARIQERILRVKAAMQERGDGDVTDVESLSPDRLRAIASSQKELLAATPEERRQCLEALERKLESLWVRVRETRKSLQVEFPAQPRYEEVLAILGQLPKDPTKQKTAIDTLRKRFVRLRRTIRERVSEETK